MASSDRSKKKRILQMKRSLQKEELEHKLDDFSGSDTEDIDFSKEIRPIGYYINDREKMIEEMFSIIKNEKFKKMLPPSLKRYSLEEIKADCLVHLLGMSKKRIYATLQGRDLNSSSDSETDSSNSVLGSDSSEEPQITSSTHVRSDVEEVDDTLDLLVSKNDLDSLIQEKRVQSNTTRRRSDKPRSQTKLTKKIKTERSPSLIEISDDEIPPPKKKKDDKRSKKKPEKKPKPKHKHPKEKSKKAKSDSSDESSDKEEDTTADGSVLVHSKKGKSLLEILELEMRARAIRALLEANTSVAESTSKVKPDPEKDKKAAEKLNTSNDDQSAENVDESDSFDVEVIDDYNNEDAIIILDDLDEQIILEPSDNPEPTEKEPSKSNTPEKEKETPKEKEKETQETESAEKEVPKIEPPDSEASKNDPASNADSSDNLTWPQRWAESKGVKEIVQNSKLCANIRKRMRFARMLKQRQQEQQQQGNPTNDNLLTELHLVEEGSIDQLQLLKLLDETTQRSNELAKKIGEPEIEETAQKLKKIGEPEIDETAQRSKKSSEPEIDQTAQRSKKASEPEIEETIQRSNEPAKNIAEPEIELDKIPIPESEPAPELEPTNAANTSDEIEEGEIAESNDEADEEPVAETTESNDKRNPSKSASSVKVVEENITANIDLTDL